MKNIKYTITTLLLTLSITLFAQNQMDIVKTNLLETAKFLEDGVYVDKKVNIIEIREQLIDTKPSQSHLLNQDRLKTPIQVTKMIKIDNDQDSLYDLTTKVSYEIIDGVMKNLKVERLHNDSSIPTDEIILEGESKEAYIIGTEDTAVFGYVDENNEFVVEYF